VDTDYPHAQALPSPNFWSGRSGFDIKYIVMHGTAGDAQPSLNWLTNPASAASVHYLVDRQGNVYQLVREGDSAWGNGIPEQGSQFLGGPNPNFFTISIEHERNVDNTSPITPQQQAASTALVADMRRRHGNLPLIPHSAISPISRAHCPGPGFPMEAIDRDSTYKPLTPAKPSADGGQKRAAPRFLVTKRMMARTAPKRTAVKFPVQMVNPGAVLNGTGKQTAHWVQVVAGGHPVWVLLANTRPV
jgi:N-acetyl-anhydromuramyl-L-alanine amidase AmpD